MSHLDLTARDVVAHHRLCDKRTRGDWIGAIKAMRDILGVDTKTAIAALEKAGAPKMEQS